MKHLPKRITKEYRLIISEFVEDLGLIPAALVTKDVQDLIFQSWQHNFLHRDCSFEELESIDSYLRRLRERADKRYKSTRDAISVLDDSMIEFNFD